MTSVRVENLTKAFGKTLAVDAVNIDVAAGQLVTLLGPSGCGKSTTLRCVAGLQDPDAGNIYFGDQLVNDVPTSRRKIGLLFQRLALFPHMKVFDNVAFGLRMKHRRESEIAQRVKEGLALVQMTGYEGRYPRQLSGGQQQRVALARTLVTDPDILLFDEPLSSLDAKLREELKLEIRRVQRQTGKTTIYVTHDQGEAFAISDKIYVMSAGRIEQVGTPIELYAHPASSFVAGFIGTNNFVAGQFLHAGHDGSGDVMVRALGGEICASAEEEFGPGQEVLVLLRPEDIVVLGEDGAQGMRNVVQGTIRACSFGGASSHLEVMVGNELLKVSVYGPDRFRLVDGSRQQVTIGFTRCTAIRAGKYSG